jgi:hypothetical protein
MKHAVIIRWSRIRAPRLRQGPAPSEGANLANTVPGIRVAHDLQMPPGRGLLSNDLMPSAYRIRALSPLRPTLALLEFG